VSDEPVRPADVELPDPPEGVNDHSDRPADHGDQQSADLPAIDERAAGR
jgi:hypothetical protein